MDIEIRSIRKTELESLHQLEKQYTESEENPNEIRKRFNAVPTTFIGAFDNGKLVGEISGELRADEIILLSIAVHDSYQKKGLGKELIRYFEKEAFKIRKSISVASAGGYVDKFYMDRGYQPREILIQIAKSDLPDNYSELAEIENEKKFGDSVFLYITECSYNPQLRDSLKEKFSAYDANYIFTKATE